MQPCPTREQLEQLLAQDLGEADRAALEGHVEKCASCQRALEELTGDCELESWRRQHASGGEDDPSPNDGFLGQVKETPLWTDLDSGAEPEGGEDSSGGNS